MLLAAGFLCVGFPAAAHPLGNFTINHLTKLTLSNGVVRARYVLDMAEIPTFQTMRAASLTRNSTSAVLDGWAAKNGRALLWDLRLTVDNARAPLTLERATARFRPGAGGLPILYMTVDARATFPQLREHQTATVVYKDATYPGRIGWHDIAISPANEPTRELTQYPNALLGSPRSITAVVLSLDSRGDTKLESATDDAAAGPSQSPVAPLLRSNQLSDMLARGTHDWSFVLLTLLVAIVLGALHALEPGHGKTLLAISLVGARATVRQATILASSLTVAHTVGVVALGVAISLLKGTFVPESVYPWITVTSAIAIVVVGARAVQRHLPGRNQLRHMHHHAHGPETHTHDRPLSEEEHARAHALPGTAPLRFGATVWAAMSGGVAPCPAALVVLLAAIALNQVTYGILVIVAFSFGLAATLTGLGIAVVHSATWLQRRRGYDNVAKYGPLASATVISLIGSVMLGQGFAQLGIAVSPAIVAALAALAIAGFALSGHAGRSAAETPA